MLIQLEKTRDCIIGSERAEWLVAGLAPVGRYGGQIGDKRQLKAMTKDSSALCWGGRRSVLEEMKTSPEQAGPRIAAALFAEYLDSKAQYELLEKACDGPPKITFLDLKIEELIFTLHCLDRAVFSHRGTEYRKVFMNHALAFTEKAFADVLSENLRKDFLDHVRERYNLRQGEYAAMPLVPAKDGTAKGTLFWEYAKRICLDAGAEHPIVLKAILDEAMTTFQAMNQIVQGL